MLFSGESTFVNFLADALAIFVLILWFWLFITTASDLLRRHDVSGLGKVMWVILLIVLPYIGIFAYILTQGGGMAERDSSCTPGRLRGMNCARPWASVRPTSSGSSIAWYRKTRFPRQSMRVSGRGSCSDVWAASRTIRALNFVGSLTLVVWRCCGRQRKRLLSRPGEVENMFVCGTGVVRFGVPRMASVRAAVPSSRESRPWAAGRSNGRPPR